MNLSIPELQKILLEAEKLPSPWRERFIAIAQDWMHLVRDEVNALKDGAQLAEDLKLGTQALAELEVIEKILALPICDGCRRLIGG